MILLLTYNYDYLSQVETAPEYELFKFCSSLGGRCHLTGSFAAKSMVR